QEFKDFGIIIYDNCSNNGISILIEKLIRSLKDKITYIRGRNILPKIQCEYLIINNYCNNPESIIVSIDADDALIGKTVLYDIYKKYEMWGVDMTCGRVHQTYRIQPHYRYPVNFINPRKTGGNVWQHLKTFKKYLFDSIPLSYFMYDDEKNKISQRKWFEKCDDFAIMIPIVEMSSSPYHMDFINYYYERDYEKRDADRELKDKCIKEIIEKQSLTKAGIIKGRKSFSANTDKIEIDITFKCNLKCNGCNRSCGLAPSDEEMSIDDINNFIADSIHNNKKWKMINILGGEPTLHSNFLQIITILQKKYADIFNKNVTIQIVSNGLTEKTKELCKQAEKLKNVIIDYESFKTKNTIDYFTPFSDAPCDDNKFNEVDYSKACWVTAYCGIGLNKNGYYACSVCGGIDRVLKTSNGVKSFTELTEDKQKEHFEKFCRLCGNFKHYSSNKGDFILRCEKMPFKNIIS
ncbi:radical SAM protein, partial [Treponema pedis]